ncbi:hypothetical protein [Natrialbaceae archaeon AArc-T1-2]|uniref:hypothetical protein n=1 Tax=Natrialbaceae archaeon AArc-T1-2 TaxID=3053904 RepID=UPI00255A8F2C|nr:hypothetical protein [Natrialbaceae archaeon AArc-T1-2]WIV66196.1 hypothetical protein QQ977_10890 [Natrialbaceae archaeon AArc-T1-2]
MSTQRRSPKGFAVAVERTLAPLSDTVTVRQSDRRVGNGEPTRADPLEAVEAVDSFGPPRERVVRGWPT